MRPSSSFQYSLSDVAIHSNGGTIIETDSFHHSRVLRGIILAFTAFNTDTERQVITPTHYFG